MSKSPEAKQRQAMRIQRRYRREKTAALLMPWFLEQAGPLRGFAWAGRNAVLAADALLAELDRTDKH